MKKISIVISVYNEEAVLDQFFREFDRIKNDLSWDYELLFVNDGSIDQSRTMLKAYAAKDAKVKVINFSRNFGHEAAMIAGIDHSSGDGVICMDADLQHPLSCIQEIITKFDEGADVIEMVRTANKSAGLIKNITSKIFYRTVNLLSSQVEFKENVSDFFAVSKRVADILKTNYREKIRFLRGYVQSVGFNKVSIEYEAAERAAGTSHYSIRRLFKFAINSIVCFSDLPLKLGIFTGLICALFGLTVLVYTLFTYKTAPSGYATIVVMMSFLFSLLFVVIGIIGEYLAVLFTEIKDRPIYLIDEIVNDDEHNG